MTLLSKLECLIEECILLARSTRLLVDESYARQLSSRTELRPLARTTGIDLGILPPPDGP